VAKFTHTNDAGEARMVDVGQKETTLRRAVAGGRVHFNREAFDALAVARLAGIQAAKRTAEWVPLCHTVPLDHLDMKIELDPDERTAEVTATATARWTTGVEMEALVAVSAACLTLYDMAKAVDRGIGIGEVRLLSKSGGRSGSWSRDDTAVRDE